MMALCCVGRFLKLEKLFMDVFYILISAWKKKNKMCIWNWFFAMYSADLTCVNGSTDRNIVSETLDGLLPILELKLKCCFCTVFHWIAIHFLIHYLPFNIFAMCCSFSISRALNKAEAGYEWSLFSDVCLRLYILAETVSLSKIWKSYPLF